MQCARMTVKHMEKTKHQTSLPRTAIFLVATAVLAMPGEPSQFASLTDRSAKNSALVGGGE
jgi:hypothetical protein